MRPIVRGPWPKDAAGNDIEYKDYQAARAELIQRLGEICSFCEMHLDASLAVEHVKPKKPDRNQPTITQRELDWHNFLLACANCNSTKGNIDVILADYLWPDRDNTFAALQYLEGGIVKPAPHLTPDLKKKAQAIIELTGLDKTPSNDAKASDRRWENRREAWEIAQQSRQNLKDCNTEAMRKQIILSVNGYWSIWMTVFKDDADMLQRLINALPGTCLECFDANHRFTPVPRPHGQC